VLRDAIALVETLTGRRAQVIHKPAQAADMPATWADITTARQVLGWQPAVAFEAGMARLVEWYREQRDWAKDVPTTAS